MSFYKEQTRRMISLLQEGRSLNVLRDFFSQLSRVRPIDPIAIINSLEPSDIDSSKLIYNSVTYRDWMKTISLEDIRNHIVFTIWKEHQIIIDSENYYDGSIKNMLYQRIYQPSNHIPSLHAENIGILLETCFYIRQICVLKELIEDNYDDLSIIDEPDWDMYHFWLLHGVNEKGLKYIVYENVKLLEPLIQLSAK
jgi:hypothetical protein